MKKVIIVLLISMGILMVVGCDEKGIKISLEDIIKKNNYLIVDVRTNEEYNESHIKGAINIPYNEIDEKINLDKTKTILVYCKSGTRSNKAYNTLKKLGYDVMDLGMMDNIKMDKE